MVLPIWLCGGRFAVGLVAVVTFAASGAQAHGPIFSPGPHTPFKGALEPHVEYQQEQATGAGEENTKQELVVGLGYGLTADLEVSP